MRTSIRWEERLRTAHAVSLVALAVVALSSHFVSAQTSPNAQKTLESSFQQIVRPFFQKNCQACHNTDLSTAGVRVDQLDASLEDRHLKTWEAIRGRLKAGTMPPKGMPQPSAADREQVVAWITEALEMALLRPAPKNCLVRRLTVAQYRNTLRELLQIDDDVTSGLPPDAVSKEGFLNNKDTLQLSPLLTEAYFEIAEEALNRAIVDPAKKPAIQNFRADLGAGVNPAPLPEKIILGAGSELLENSDFQVTQLTPVKSFAFRPFTCGPGHFTSRLSGNDTARGWRDFDSIAHAVFADMRGAAGYPKGKAYSTVPEALLLRPAIPSEEIFGVDNTYGPRANFKISVRELPTGGRFRVTVVASKYRDGLLLDAGIKQQAKSKDAVMVEDPKQPKTVTIRRRVYQVDLQTEVMPCRRRTPLD
jgi:mono/diheme cytochrome c family protein